MTADECVEVLKRLEPIYTFSQALVWMQNPHPLLNDRKPIDAPYADVLNAIEAMEGGVYV